MLYFLHGTDTHASRKKLHELLAAVHKKRPDAELFRMNADNWSSEQFDELVASRGLFESKYIVVLDHVWEKKDAKDHIVERRADMHEAEHVFLVLEGKTDVATVKKMEATADKAQEFTAAESGKKERFNIFSLTDGLVARDKKRLWVSYRELLAQGAAPEEMHGILFWQVKNMLLASRAHDQKETGLTPFAYKNALSGSRNFSDTELASLSSSLVDMTHRVRTGAGEMEIMLEKLILTL